MAGGFRGFCLAIGLFAALLTSMGGCPGNDFAGLSIIPSATAGQSNNDAAAGAAADAATNAGNPDRPADSSPSDSAAAAPAQNFSDCSDPRQEAEWQATILALVNNERVKAGVGTVSRNTALEAQAGEYACEMIHYDFFDHVNPVTHSTLGQRATQFGYNYSVVGENLAAGQTSPEQAFTDWMNSPGHRQNILDPRFVELGIGIRSGGVYGLYWVQEFGKPQISR